MALKSYALLPLPEEPKTRDAEIRARYLKIEEFLKGSKKFGSQRQANNQTCAEVAQINRTTPMAAMMMPTSCFLKSSQISLLRRIKRGSLPENSNT